MSDQGPTASAPTSAPATSPSTNGPAAAPAPSPTQALAGAATGTAANGAPAVQQPPSTRIPWKTKIALADLGEREVEVDVDPFLREYKRKVKADGREFEVPVDEAYKSYERVRSSMARFDEAAKIRKEVEGREAKLQEREKALQAALGDPKRVLEVARRTLGEDAFRAALVQQVRDWLEYEQMEPGQRAQYDQRTEAEKRIAQREAEIAKREREFASREQQAKAAREQQVKELAARRQQELIAEWVPAIEAAGLPAKIKGQPNTRVIQMVADTLSRAKRNGMPMTLGEAIATVKEEYDAMVGHSVATQQQQALQAAQEQPGRGEPVVAPAAPPSQRHRSYAGEAEEFERSLRASWRK